MAQIPTLPRCIMDKKLTLPPITSLYPIKGSSTSTIVKPSKRAPECQGASAFHAPLEPALTITSLLQTPHGRTHQHARSYSDYTHPFASLPMPVGLVRPQPRRAPTDQQQHRRTVSSSAVDEMMRCQQQERNEAIIRQQPASPPEFNYSKEELPHHHHHHHHQPQPPASSLSSPSSSSAPVLTSTPCPLSPSASTSSTEDTDKYKCPHCRKGFSRPSSLRIHVYSHTGEKPFDCPEPGCGRRFNVQSNLRRHLRIHRGIPKSVRRASRGATVRMVPIAPAQPHFM